MENETKIPLFRRFVIQNFPYIEQDFDALTDYQLISKIVEYLNKVIESQNGLVDDMNDLETAFNTLKDYVDHYFDNLDVQTEINNKLDAMVEAGTLQEIVSEYLNATAIWGFDTVSDMKSATNLINGSFAKTLGFNTKNDGGGATYKIRNITNDDVVDDSTIIEIGDVSNELIAELILEPIMNVKQFGVTTSNTTNTKFQIALTKCEGRTLIIPDGTYRIDTSMNLPANIEIKCFGKITYSGDIVYLFQRTSGSPTDKIIFDGVNIEKLDNSFANLNRFIYVSGGNLTVINSRFKNYNTAIHHNEGENFVCKNNILENVHGTLEQDGYGVNTSSKYNTIDNIQFLNANNTEGRHAIYLNGAYMVSAYINNILVNKWHHNPININISNTTAPDIIIENCVFNDTTIIADGSNPKRVIGVINVTQNCYCNLIVNNVKATALPNNLICSISEHATVKARNCESTHVTSDSDYATGIYLRYGSGTHYVDNYQCNNTGDDNFLYAIYVRQADAVINGVFETGTNGTSMVISNNATVSLGEYNTAKTVKTLSNSGTVSPISYYTNS